MTTTDQPTMNVEALRNVYTWVEKQELLREQGLPSEWHQADWMVDIAKFPWLQRKLNQSCGTACCIAGHVALELGHRPFIDSRGVMSAVAVDDQGRTREVGSLAREHLGLDVDQAHALFAGTNTFADITRILTEWGVIGVPA